MVSIYFLIAGLIIHIDYKKLCVREFMTKNVADIEISTCPLTQVIEFHKKGFRASTSKFSLAPVGKLIFSTLNI